jgi:hypothetical protein
MRRHDKILVVDDEATRFAALSIATPPAKPPARVDAGNGEEAIRMIAKGAPISWSWTSAWRDQRTRHVAQSAKLDPNPHHHDDRLWHDADAIRQ